MAEKVASITFSGFVGVVCYSSSRDRHPECRVRHMAEDEEYKADDEEGLASLFDALAEGDTEGACDLISELFFGAWWGYQTGAEVESVDSLELGLSFREE